MDTDLGPYSSSESIVEDSCPSMVDETSQDLSLTSDKVPKLLRTKSIIMVCPTNTLYHNIFKVLILTSMQL